MQLRNERKIKKLKRFFKYQIYFIAVRILSFFSRLRKKPQNNTVTIIKYDGIGDFVLFLDAAKGLRELYKDKKIILSCSSPAKEIADKTDYFDEVIFVDKKIIDNCYLKELLSKAKSLDCEILINMAISRDFASEILVSFVSAKEKISANNTNFFAKSRARWAKSLYTRILTNELDTMVIEQNAEIVRQLGYEDFASSMPHLPAVENIHLYVPNNYFLMFLGGSTFAKRWPVDRFYSIAKFIISNTGLKCVIAGSNTELEQENYLNQQRDFDFISYIGRTNIFELQYLVSKSRFVLGNDTCAIHMAASVGVQSIAIASAVSSNRFYPYCVERLNDGVAPYYIKSNVPCAGCSFNYESYQKCINKESKHNKKKCIDMISIDDVLNKVSTFLQEEKLIINN